MNRKRCGDAVELSYVVKRVHSWFTEKSRLTATGRHLPYGSQCYLPPDTSERAPPYPQPVSLAGTPPFTYAGGMEG